MRYTFFDHYWTPTSGDSVVAVPEFNNYVFYFSKQVCQHKQAATKQENKQWVVVIVLLRDKQFTDTNKQNTGNSDLPLEQTIIPWYDSGESRNHYQQTVQFWLGQVAENQQIVRFQN